MIDPFASLPDPIRAVLAGARNRTSPEESWESLTRSQQLEYLGAPEVEIEQARQQERLLGPTGLQNVARASTAQGEPLLGTEEPAPRMGLLQFLGDYATRLQSATTGFATGLAGMERLRETRDEFGRPDGTLFEEPEPVEGGLGLALERFGQGIRGEEKFQAADFGALAYDRNEASTSERFLKSAAGFVLDVALDPLTYVSFGGSILGRRMGAVAVNSQARKNVNDLVTANLDELGQASAIRDAVARAGTDEGIITANLRKQLAGTDFPTAGLSTVDETIELLARRPEALQAAANDAIAYTAAGIYRAFGPGATLKWLKSEFGRNGVALFKSLPRDLQGGVRIRVPFSGLVNRATGRGAAPSAIGLSPLGTGVVSDALGLTQLSNGARNWMRTKMLLRPLGDNLSGATGATDRATATLIYNRSAGELSGKIFGRRSAEVDKKLRATSWASSQEVEAALAAFRAGVFSSARQLHGPITEAQAAYRRGIDLGEEQFGEAFDTAIKNNLADPAGNVMSMEDVFGGKVTDVQQAAYEAAFGYQAALRQIESQLMELENKAAGFAPKMLENYWPRIVDDMERELTGKGYRGGFSNLKERSHFVAEYNADGSVKRWMTPSEIGAQLGRDKFIVDADKAMSAYIISMNRFIQEERLFQHLFDGGVLFRGGPQAFDSVPDLSAARGRWIDTWNRVNARKQAVEGLGRGEDAARVSSAGLVGDELEDAVANAQRLGEAIQGGRVHGPRLIGDYNELEPGRRWISADGVSLNRAENGTFTVARMKRGGGSEYLKADGSWASEADSFLTFDDARAVADRAMATSRKRQFVRQMEDMRDEFFRNYTAMLKGRELNPFDPPNIPLDHQGEYFETLVDGIRRFGDASGLTGRDVKARVYREEKWGGGRGAAFAPVTGGNGPKMRKFWSDRMERMGVFAPETVADDVANIYRAFDDPEGFKKWVEDYYKPFYALQKSLMTSQRGPGYILRNIQGGMWNAWLVGTKARHFRVAGAVKAAEYEARRAARAAAPDDLRRQGEIMREEFVRIIDRKLGKGRGEELANIWELFEQRGLRGREVASRTMGEQAVPGITGDLGGNLIRAFPDADANRVQRVAQWGTSHWWARTMAAGAQGSEDYLRFASFLRGVDAFGLEDGGRAASLMVKASQFDYSDLSRFEAETVKMLIPFYTWTRNNVPLQMRAIMSEPGKVMRAIRLNDALGDAFGDEEDPGEPLPSYVRERFGWKVREDIAVGPFGDALSAGMVVGEPLVDVNRLFGTPTSSGGWGLGSVVNWREVANNLNPAISGFAPVVTSMELSTGGRLPAEEEAPGWARALGLGRVTPEGDRVMSARFLRGLRDIVVPLGMVERYAPQIAGNERLERRWYTSLASAVLGLPVSTLDPYQTTAELRAQESRLRGRMQRDMGEAYADRVGYVREVLKMAATPQEMQFIRDTLLGGQDVQDVDASMLDVYRMRDTLEFFRRLDQMRERGVPEEQLRMMAAYFKPRTDASERVRGGGPQPLTEEQLAELGETPLSVAQMTDAERAELVARYQAENPEWVP